MGTSYFKFRQEELPVVGEILMQLFKRDQKKFRDFSEDYNDEYAKSVKDQIVKVQDLIQASGLTAEISKITQDLYQKMSDIVAKLDLVAAYAQRANKSLNIKSSDFGIKECKKELRRKNVEGFSAKMTMVEQNIEKNLEALKAKGYREDLGAEIEKLSKKIHDLNLKQEEKLTQRKQLVAENMNELDTLWKMISDISKTGKLLLKNDKSKAEDYMLTNVFQKVRKQSVKSTKRKKALTLPPLAPVVEEPAAIKKKTSKKEEDVPQTEATE